jgi:hypothetical protein
MDDDENKRNSDRDFIENTLLEFLIGLIFFLLGILVDLLKQ